jgi:regulator of sirC expression with transglutaminase-like and TPR domain
MQYDPQEIVDNLASLVDEDIDLGLVALALAASEQPGISMERYVHHLKVLADDVQSVYHGLLEGGGAENVDVQLEALRAVISERHDYIGDSRDYDDLENSSLIRVIERTKGIPITLSILYICAGRAMGWDICGLNIPGHFVCRLEYAGQRLIFDPFNDCKVLEASDLRMLVKRSMGEKAELSSQYFEPASNRDILIRLQNNIKHRQIDDENYEGALVTVQRMQKIAPKEYRLLLDAGVLYAKVEQNRAAIDALERYLQSVPKGNVYRGETREAELLLSELRGRLN